MNEVHYLNEDFLFYTYKAVASVTDVTEFAYY